MVYIHTVNGKQYTNLQAACKAAGVNYARATKWLHSHKHCEISDYVKFLKETEDKEAKSQKPSVDFKEGLSALKQELTSEKKTPTKDTRDRWAGVDAFAEKEFAERLAKDKASAPKIKVEEVQAPMLADNEPDEPKVYTNYHPELTTQPATGIAIPTVVNGVSYKSIAEACRALGIQPATYSNWKFQHKDEDDVSLERYVNFFRQAKEASEPVKKASSRVVYYEGKEYRSLAYLLKELGIVDGTFYAWKTKHYTGGLIEGSDVTEILHAFNQRNKYAKTKSKEPAEVTTPTEPKEEIAIAKSTAHKNADNERLIDLAEFRLLSRAEKVKYLDVSEEQMMKTMRESGPISLEGIMDFTSVLDLIERMVIDPSEVYYLGYVCHLDWKEAIRLSKAPISLAEIAPSTVMTPQEKYCEDCGEVIEHRFLKTHPFAKYCRLCYDKHED